MDPTEAAALGRRAGAEHDRELRPHGGSLLLFKLPTSVYSNRPLTLHIFSPSGGKGQIDLDL